MSDQFRRCRSSDDIHDIHDNDDDYNVIIDSGLAGNNGVGVVFNN